ncbi:hypothetical protein, partial [Morganella sp. HSTU-ASny43]|uniref:hypothetical protein n=1 Tax=Morganella sp. HSTU-ASny43 TaxID=2681968 RepID=UPI001FB6D4BF
FLGPRRIPPAPVGRWGGLVYYRPYLYYFSFKHVPLKTVTKISYLIFLIQVFYCHIVFNLIIY